MRCYNHGLFIWWVLTILDYSTTEVRWNYLYLRRGIVQFLLLIIVRDIRKRFRHFFILIFKKKKKISKVKFPIVKLLLKSNVEKQKQKIKSRS